MSSRHLLPPRTPFPSEIAIPRDQSEFRKSESVSGGRLKILPGYPRGPCFPQLLHDRRAAPRVSASRNAVHVKFGLALSGKRGNA